jgi:hypothetical protein
VKLSRRRGLNRPSGARATAWIAAIAAVLTQGCSSNGPAGHAQDPAADASTPDADDGDGGADDGDGAVIVRMPTFSSVYQQVLVPNCALVFCHAGTGDYLELADMEIGYASLVNAPAQGPGCAQTGLKRVDPGHPETSLLVLKVTTPPCGDKMPRSYGSSMSLEPAAIQQIKDWITLGAKND